MDPSVQIREQGFRGDGFLMQIGLETKKRGSRQVRWSHSWVDTICKRTQEDRRLSPAAVQKQNCTQQHWEHREHDVGLGFSSEASIGR